MTLKGYDLDGTIVGVRPAWLLTFSIWLGVHGKKVLGKRRWGLYRWMQRHCAYLKLRPHWNGVIITARTKNGMGCIQPFLRRHGIQLPVIHRENDPPRDLEAKVLHKAGAIRRAGVTEYYENEWDQALLIQTLVGTSCKVILV